MRRGSLLIRAAVESDIILSPNALLTLLVQLRRVCAPEGPGVSLQLSAQLHELADAAGASLAALLRAAGLEAVGDRPQPTAGRPASGASGRRSPHSPPAVSRASFAHS